MQTTTKDESPELADLIEEYIERQTFMEVEAKSNKPADRVICKMSDKTKAIYTLLKQRVALVHLCDKIIYGDTDDQEKKDAAHVTYDDAISDAGVLEPMFWISVRADAAAAGYITQNPLFSVRPGHIITAVFDAQENGLAGVSPAFFYQKTALYKGRVGGRYHQDLCRAGIILRPFWLNAYET